MFVYDNVFKNENDIRRFVCEAEEKYRNQVLKIAEEIIKIDHIKFLTLSGPTCSGKTTTSYILEKEFENRGMTVKIISIDDFYRDRSDISDDEIRFGVAHGGHSDGYCFIPKITEFDNKITFCGTIHYIDPYTSEKGIKKIINKIDEVFLNENFPSPQLSHEIQSLNEDFIEFLNSLMID